MKINKFIFTVLLFIFGFSVSQLSMAEERTGNFRREKVWFRKANLRLAGDMYFPRDFDANKKYSAIVVVHPGGGVKEQTAGLYASKLAEKGFIALAYDAAYQGESEGEPRFLEDPASRVEDVRAAVDYFSTLPYVDMNRVGALGICAGGGYAFNATQTEYRIKAVAGVSAVDFGSSKREGINNSTSPEQFREMMREVGEQRSREANGAPYRMATYVPNSLEGIPANASPMYREGYEYYRTSRGGHPRSENKVIFTSFDRLSAFHAFDMIETISPRPILFIVGGEADTAYFSKNAYDRALAPKDYRVIPGASHIDLYDKPQYVTPAVDILTEFYEKYLIN